MKKALVFALFFMLTACFNGTSSPSHFYTLDAIQENTHSSRPQFSIGLDRVRIARYLDRPQIITRSENKNEITLSETHRWIEPLPDLIQRVLAEDLSTQLPSSLVKVKTQGREPFQYLVSVDITRLDAVFGKTAVLKGWWLIQDKEGKIVSREKASVSTPLGTTYADLAQANSQLLFLFSQKLANSLIRLK